MRKELLLIITAALLTACADLDSSSGAHKSTKKTTTTVTVSKTDSYKSCTLQNNSRLYWNGIDQRPCAY